MSHSNAEMWFRSMYGYPMLEIYCKDSEAEGVLQSYEYPQISRRL